MAIPPDLKITNPIPYPMRPLTALEAQHVLDCASRVKMRHRLFNAVEFVFSIDPRGDILIAMQAKVPDRTAPPTYNARLVGDEYYAHDDRVDSFLYAYGLEARAIAPRPELRKATMIVISVERAVGIIPAPLLDPSREKDLTAWFANKLREELLWFARHEIDEMIEVNGEPVRDPHSIQHIEISGKVTL
jgi:hypothetical protein